MGSFKKGTMTTGNNVSDLGRFNRQEMGSQEYKLYNIIVLSQPKPLMSRLGAGETFSAFFCCNYVNFKSIREK